jgi:hypothetical protein
MSQYSATLFFESELSSKHVVRLITLLELILDGNNSLELFSSRHQLFRSGLQREPANRAIPTRRLDVWLCLL